MLTSERLRLFRRRLLMEWRRRIWGLKKVHPSAYIAPGCRLSRDLELGELGFINHGCQIGPNVRIGRYSLLAPHVVVIGADHCIDIAGTPIVFAGRPDPTTTEIGQDCWVGFGSKIMAGVHVADGAIIAAGSVVTRDVGRFEIHGGVPNKKLRDRFSSANEIAAHLDMLCGETVHGKFCAPKKILTDQPK